MDCIYNSARAALVTSLALMVASAILPQFGVALGVVLTGIGVATLVYAFLSNHDSESVFGVVTLVFGLVLEFAALETLPTLLAVAVIIDAVMLFAKTIAESIEGLIERLG